jgi:hypothetical protein
MLIDLDIEILFCFLLVQVTRTKVFFKFHKISQFILLSSESKSDFCFYVVPMTNFMCCIKLCQEFYLFRTKIPEISRVCIIYMSCTVRIGIVHIYLEGFCSKFEAWHSSLHHTNILLAFVA